MGCGVLSRGCAVCCCCPGRGCIHAQKSAAMPGGVVLSRACCLRLCPERYRFCPEAYWRGWIAQKRTDARGPGGEQAVCFACLHASKTETSPLVLKQAEIDQAARYLQCAVWCLLGTCAVCDTLHMLLNGSLYVAHWPSITYHRLHHTFSRVCVCQCAHFQLTSWSAEPGTWGSTRFSPPGLKSTCISRRSNRARTKRNAGLLSCIATCVHA